MREHYTVSEESEGGAVLVRHDPTGTELRYTHEAWRGLHADRSDDEVAELLHEQVKAAGGPGPQEPVPWTD